MRKGIPAKVKLEVTMRYLATGDSLYTLEGLHRVARSTIAQFIPEVCNAIYNALKEYMRIPCHEDWNRIEHGFRTKLNFPGCIGALDGKHINTSTIPNNTSDYYDYKGRHSIILLGLVDDDYCFSYINVGTNGRASDGVLESNTPNSPDKSVIVADAAFPLKAYHIEELQRIKKKYLTTVYQELDELLKMLTRFRVLLNAIDMAPKIVDKIILAACSLHNWLWKTSDMHITQRCVDFEDMQRVVVTRTWRTTLQRALEGLPPTRYSNRASQKAEAIRDTYAQLFETTEAVPWQDHMI
nr:unnamed protein product [Callosobruchus analis]